MTSTKPSCNRRAGGCRLWRLGLKEFETGSRPEEIDRASADLEDAKADLANAKVNLERNQKLRQRVSISKQALDDAKARYDRELSRSERIAEVVRTRQDRPSRASRSTPFGGRSSKLEVPLPSSKISWTIR